MTSIPGADKTCRALVLFGATGDLARRMLWPSLYGLHRDGLLPPGFRIVGAATSVVAHEAFIARVREAILQSSNASFYDEPEFEAFAGSERGGKRCRT